MIRRYYIYPENPQKREIQMIGNALRKGAVIIFPTDTIYAMGCLLSQKKSIEKIVRVSGKKEKQIKMSLICSDISMASQFCPPFSNHVFKAMKRALPGPFTFILPANVMVERLFKSSKKEIGIRIPDSQIVQDLIEECGEPLISTSLRKDDEFRPYYVDPDIIEDKYSHEIDILVDGGLGDERDSTIVDCTSGDLEIIREGKGDISLI